MFFLVQVSVLVTLWTSTFLNTSRYFCMRQWMRVRGGVVFILIIDCSIPPPHWHLCTHPLLSLSLVRERSKTSSEMRGCLLSQKDTNLSKYWLYWKLRHDKNQTKATQREGGGRRAARVEVKCFKVVLRFVVNLMFCFSWVHEMPGMRDQTCGWGQIVKYQVKFF